MKYLMFLMLFLGNMTLADTPVPFGLFVQLLDTTDNRIEEVSPDLSRRADLAAAEAILREREQVLGPYHPALAPLMVEVAAIASALGDLSRAADFYDRALHNVRVNNGLYGDQQLPILRGLIALYLESGDREALEERAAYQFRLLGSGLPPFEEGELKAALEFFDVTLDVLMDVGWGPRGRELLQFHDRFDAMTAAVCQDPSVRSEWCQPFTFRLAGFYYVLEFKLDVLVDDQRFESAFSDPEWGSLEREPRLEALQRRLVRKGEDVFERLLSVSPDQHDGLSALADWLWFYRQKTRAMALYEQACRLQPDRFEKPGALPEYPALKRLMAFMPGSSEAQLTLSVTDRGVAKNVVVAVSNPATDDRAAAKLKRVLRDTAFRPALHDCVEPVALSPLAMDVVSTQ
ncbi:tetratricopeptide repeat protein [Luminiphilus sp.]|nr:tetratricopeptide repeat protein [Luminiphilus sp.]